MKPSERRALMDRYRDGYRAVVDALAEVDLDAPGADGGWTPRQVVHHLADSERLTEDEWARRATHTESGEYGVEIWLEIYAAHALDHAEQIRRCKP